MNARELVKLLHAVDGQLGLAVHRGEGSRTEWKAEADQLIGRVRIAVKSLERRIAEGEDDVMLRRLRPGDVLFGFCGGHFGRDSYGDKVVLDVGVDYVTARERTGPALLAVCDPGDLVQYTTPEVQT